jgi:nucleoside-diphosphate-sugar epimerase
VRVLITGSAGFVGGHLVKALRAAQHQVVGVDVRAPVGDPVSIRADLRSVAARDVGGVDVCVHLASEVGGFLHNCERSGQVDNEVSLLAAVAKLCSNVGCRRIIYMSSIAVFEVSDKFAAGPLQAFEQRTPYACAKAQAERALAEQFEEFVVVRPTNVFGPGQRRRGLRVGESHVIPDLLHKIRFGSQLEVLGDGTQRRNFIHVSDVVRFLTAVLKKPERGWFNLRSEIQLSIGALAEELLKITGSRRRIVYLPDYLRYEPRPIEAFDLSGPLSIGWRPIVSSLAEGLRPFPASSSSTHLTAPFTAS